MSRPAAGYSIALVTAMAIGALIYVAVVVTAVSVVPWRELSEAPGPLTEVMARAAPTISPWVFTAVTLFAVANTALVNYITSSRLDYGMAQQGLLPSALGRVHHRTRTPHLAAIMLLAILLPLGLFGTVADLASASVLLLLIVFVVVNGALSILKGRRDEPAGRFEIPRWVPAAGTVICLLLVGLRVSSSDWRAPALAGALLVGILALHALVRSRGAAPAGAP
jgi:APA family basic amino acid/polyamine antiporter